ncbi:hypothetical protein [Streptacidiphilus pinicola]|uniref:hypothetical protein n=1 Tax=Streptacidiphilus pinicola TaxID=2219663 RepID=UPI001057647A|nr:hypothetical protein [Streptacidiphilus pinicola]
MTALRRSGQRPPTPRRTQALTVAFFAVVGLITWNEFVNGNTARAWLLVVVFFGLPALGALGQYAQFRRGSAQYRQRPGDPQHRQRRDAAYFLVGLTGIGALAIVAAKPVDRAATGIVVGVALAVITLVLWAIVWGPRD